MNILYTSSDQFSYPGLISIQSLLENNMNEDEIKIYYIENDISFENKKRIIEVVLKYNRTIEFISLPDMSNYSSGILRTNSVVYSYCFIQEILPNNIEKVLLIECDTIVLKPLKDLYNTELQNYYVAAADDIKSKWYKKALSLNENSPYFNTGIMLFNLKKIREDEMTKKILGVITMKNSKLFYEVQDELNIAYKEKVKILPPKYNCTTALFIYDYKNMIRYRRPSSCFSKTEYIEAIESPYIVHFTTNQIIQSRPWIENCQHPFKKIYMDIRKRVSDGNDKLWDSNRSLKNKLAYLFYKTTPKFFSSFFLGLIQAYLYPILVYLKVKGE